jgi:hypothetical protein
LTFAARKKIQANTVKMKVMPVAKNSRIVGRYLLRWFDFAGQFVKRVMIDF